MADRTAQIAKLEEALAKGTLTVEADGRRITYRSMDDLLKALNYFKADQAAAAPGAAAAGGPFAATLATFGEG